MNTDRQQAGSQVLSEQITTTPIAARGFATATATATAASVLALTIVASLILVLFTGCALQEEDSTGTSPTESPAIDESRDGGGKGSQDSSQAPKNSDAQETYSDSAFSAGGSTSSDIMYPTEPISPDPSGGEEYAHVDENGFIATASQPLSTFSADVDTASYANLRRMITSGYDLSAIPSGAIRIEEMLNYFDYDYTGPEGSDLFGTQATVADCPWNEDTKLLVMGFATEEVDYENAEGSNLVFLIDTSGSMNSSEKLPLLQKSFTTLLDQLTWCDTVSIVTYASEERIICEGVSASDRKTLVDSINSLHASGSTNGEAGLEQAYRVAEKHFIDGGNNRIILASDGDLNVGISSTDELYDFVSEKRDTGVYLSVLGFGSGNYKDAKMEILADNGDGAYHYIDCIDEAEKVFKKDLSANLITLAKDVKLQVEFNPDQVKGYRLIGYENRVLADEDFDDESIDAGEIGQGHRFTVAYELVMADSDYEMPEPDLKYSKKSEGLGFDDWLTCSMRYKPVDSSETKQQSFTVDSKLITAAPDDDWRFAAAVIEAGMVIGESKYQGTASLESVTETLDEIELDSPEKNEFRNLIGKLQDN